MKPSEISVQSTVWVKIATRSNIILVDNAKYPIGFKKVKKKDTSVTFKSEIAQIIGAKKSYNCTRKINRHSIIHKTGFPTKSNDYDTKSVSIFIPRQNKNPIWYWKAIKVHPNDGMAGTNMNLRGSIK